MSLFNRNAPAPPTFPEGYDDPSAPTFIPEAARPFWDATEPDYAQLESRRAALIEAEARTKSEALQRAAWEQDRRSGNTDRHGAFVLDVRDSAPFPVSSFRRELNSSPTDRARLAEQATHSLHVEAAERAASVSAKQLAADEQRRQMNTCPLCGVQFGSGIARPVVSRWVINGDGNSIRLTCCELCADAINVAHADRLRAEVVRDGKTRVQIVADALGIR